MQQSRTLCGVAPIDLTAHRGREARDFTEL